MVDRKPWAIGDHEGQSFGCHEDESVLAAMVRQGKRLIPVGCRNGGCGLCKIRIRGGDFLAKKMSRLHVTTLEESQGVTLACRTFPRSDLFFELCRAPERGEQKDAGLDQGATG